MGVGAPVPPARGKDTHVTLQLPLTLFRGKDSGSDIAFLLFAGSVNQKAEKLNGRAAMVGYFAALVVDGLSGAGIWDQQNSFFGKVLLNVVVIGVLFVRNVKDLDKFKNLFNEATFYDSQWNASWEGVERPEIEDE